MRIGQALLFAMIAGNKALRPAIRLLPLFLLLTAASCSTINPPSNEAITRIEDGRGYRPNTIRLQNARGDNMVLLAFSGGGTRAAALSYGVMQELRDTLIPNGDTTIRLLDQVDTISSVSGGSFTAAYYGLYRDRLFEDYEDDFLRQGVQQALIKQLLNPVHWIRSSFNGFNRTEMAIDYYDRIMFNEATFSDMAKNGPPFIAINATDLGSGLRFTFTQNLFDLICTDLGSYPIARAVTASSAVPVAFPPVVLKNHAANCAVDDYTDWLALKEMAPTTAVQSRIVEGLRSYRNAEQREYIHLVDGGIADNLGLRVMTDQLERLGARQLKALSKLAHKNILIVLVNAEVNPERLIEQSPRTPSLSTTMSAVSSAQFDSYNRETLDRFKDLLHELEDNARAAGTDTKIYFSQVNFDHVQAREINRVLNALPTTLALEDIDVDRLIVAGRLILRNEPDFQAFKARNNATLAAGALSEEVLCQYFDYPSCEP